MDEVTVKRRGRPSKMPENDVAKTTFDLVIDLQKDAVERKFQYLKSPQFVNALYVDSPNRVEAIGYLMLILMLILSVAEYVVRRELESEKKTIIDPGNVKMVMR